MSRLNRHDLYYRLIDFSLAGQLLAAGVGIAMQMTKGEIVPDVVQIPYSIIVALAFLIPCVLIFQRWMRDDFSEMLWQRTAGSVLKLLIVLPIPIALAAGYFTLSADDADVIERARSMKNRLDPLLNAHVQGMTRAFIYLWMATPVFFTFAFQWHRWRASR